MAGNNEENVPRAIKTLFNVTEGLQVFGKPDARQVTAVLAGGCHVVKQVELHHAAEAYIAVAARELQRQRCSPGTSADYGNSLCGRCTYQCVSVPADSC